MANLDLLLHQARFELRALLRNRQARFTTLLLPPALLIVFVSAVGDGTVGHYVPSISALAVLVACFANLVVSVTAQREAGVLKRRRATPVPAWVLIAGRALAAMVVSLGSVAAVCLLGHAAYGVALPVTAIPVLAVTAVAGSISFASVAYALTSGIGSADAAQPIVQALTVPLYIVSGVFVPDADLPSWLRELGRALPLEHLAHGLLYGLQRGVPEWSDLAVLAAWTAGGLTIAVRNFRWAPAGAGT